MADVRVGVDRHYEDYGGPAGVEYRQHWVQVGDVKLTADDHGLLDVTYGVTEVGGYGVATIRVLTSSFATEEAERG